MKQSKGTLGVRTKESQRQDHGGPDHRHLQSCAKHLKQDEEEPPFGHGTYSPSGN